GRLVREVRDLAAVLQPVPEMDASRWMAECRWTPSDAFQIPSDWPSGVYMAMLTTQQAAPADQRSAYIPFVVRADFYPHQIVYQVPFATYHASSAWPRQSTRYWNAGITCGNLYGGSGPDASTRSYAVSFNRPIAQYWGSGDFFAYEYPLVCWMERE